MEREDHPILPALHGDAVHQPDGGLFHAGIAAEAGEVVLAGEVRRRLTHPLHVGAVVQQRHILSVKYRLHRPIKAGVAVGLAQRVVAGMETRCGLLHLPDGDGVGQVAVQVVADGLRRLRHVQHRVGGHGTGVDARVGAARAGDLHRPSL